VPRSRRRASEFLQIADLFTHDSPMVSVVWRTDNKAFVKHVLAVPEDLILGKRDLLKTVPIGREPLRADQRI